MLKCKENCLNFVTIVGESGKEYQSCVVLFQYPQDFLCRGCDCFVDLDGTPCEREDKE